MVSSLSLLVPQGMPKEMKDDEDSSAKVYYRRLSGKGHHLSSLNNSSLSCSSDGVLFSVSLLPPRGMPKEMKDDEDSSAKVYYRRLSGKSPSVEISGASGLLNLLWLYITSFVTGHSQ
ncbi:hypothetical protein CEXT_523221 [Caerostris extrusa]|uniref:Uncharacterized protein n=1 Tax=Caerostris extrusa TaxID=172846 RepID=A0AAV4RPA8_CAEEX|nr:hypothetical protein CEXT_523221 [Caerostris extrusa]